MEHDEELIESHVGQLKELKDVTEKQTTELKKGRKEFGDLNLKIDDVNGRVKKIEDELVEKKVTNGNTQREIKSLRETIIETNTNVAYLRGLKDGEEKVNKEKKEDKRSNKSFYVQVVFICFALANFIYLILNEVLNWI